MQTGTFQFLPEVVEKFSRSHRLCDALAAVRSSMLSLSVVADTKGKIYDASTFKEYVARCAFDLLRDALHALSEWYAGVRVHAYRFKHSPVEFARKAADSARAAREAAVAVAPEFFPISSIDEKPEVSARVWQRLPAWRVHELTELAEAAISIGRRRGFRMSEPTQAHIDLATHLVQESVRGTHLCPPRVCVGACRRAVCDTRVCVCVCAPPAVQVASHDAVMHVLRGAAETADPRPKPHVHVMPTPLG
ncbi:hypothetical protein EON67_02900 [archaeon]|nr:MAG: hypothetical protein EON67_02900 [archaeon]